MSELPYREIPAAPSEVSAATLLVRLVDGLAFRYRWATEGLREQDLAFRPVEGARSASELLDHLHHLVSWVERTVCEAPDGDGETAPPAGSLDERRRATLLALERLRAALLEISDEDLARLEIVSPRKGAKPFWNMINGPLADALTHVGQINAYRRMNGNPTPRADVFRGLPPRG